MWLLPYARLEETRDNMKGVSIPLAIFRTVLLTPSVVLYGFPELFMTHSENSAPTETARYLPPLRMSGSFESTCLPSELLFLPHGCEVVQPRSLCNWLISLSVVLRKDARGERQTKIGFK